jgi:hypothetical protein
MDRAATDVGDPYDTPMFLGVVDWVIRHRHVPPECDHQFGTVSKIVEDAQQKARETEDRSTNRGYQRHHE